MLDLRLIREQPDVVKDGLAKLYADPGLVDTVVDLDDQWRTLTKALQELQTERNSLSKSVSQTRDAAERQPLIEQSKRIGERISGLDAQVADVKTALDRAMLEIPNLPDPDVPVGKDDSENVIFPYQGEKRAFDFAPKAHWDLGPALGILDLERGVRLAGSRGYVLVGMGARLQRSLIQWMLDVHVGQGYTEIFPPYVVNREMLVGTGNLPKFTDNLYSLAEEPEKYLIPTAEVPLTNFHREEILNGADLPILLTANSTNFRREQFSAGRDTRGIKRVHQFDKVEMVRLEKPENSKAALRTLIADAEVILRDLEIPYRLLQMCTGDLSFVSAEKFDLEAWAPGCDEWLEVSSCGNFTDFQARRANIRFRREAGARPEYVHTLNGSGLALPRLMIAIMENYQNADGTITIPEVIRPYMHGMERIEREK
ncbi:MAG: serine--tRNA ligase [Thermomicrobia bacterium]|nr:serine--tRNA ligase [Thermomicrobia bacterium]MCA1725377.1 serine--tRNA ligase [Thermomicrobia bacterium]